jgi:superfamily II DNA helicase RecQ
MKPPKIDIILAEEHQFPRFEGLSIDARLEPFYGNIKIHTSQQRVCLELLNGRYAQSSKSELRHDVFFSAPCGFGKSLSFVAVATILGGITVRY